MLRLGQRRAACAFGKWLAEVQDAVSSALHQHEMKVEAAKVEARIRAESGVALAQAEAAHRAAMGAVKRAALAETSEAVQAEAEKLRAEHVLDTMRWQEVALRELAGVTEQNEFLTAQLRGRSCEGGCPHMAS